MGGITTRDRIAESVARKLQLLRGYLYKLRGCRAGVRFGIGTHVRIRYLSHLQVGDDVSIGDGSYLNCLCATGVKFGSFSSVTRTFWLSCGGKPDSPGFFIIGDHSSIGPHAVMGAGGGITIGNHVMMGPNVTITAENHVFEDPDRRIDEQGVCHKGVVIEDDCWIAGGVTILDGVRVGHGSVIGAGAVVTRDIPPYSVAVGVPARTIKTRGERS